MPARLEVLRGVLRRGDRSIRGSVCPGMFTKPILLLKYPCRAGPSRRYRRRKCSSHRPARLCRPPPTSTPPRLRLAGIALRTPMVDLTGAGCGSPALAYFSRRETLPAHRLVSSFAAPTTRCRRSRWRERAAGGRRGVSLRATMPRGVRRGRRELLGMPAVIVMPADAPRPKRGGGAPRRLGAEGRALRPGAGTIVRSSRARGSQPSENGRPGAPV